MEEIEKIDESYVDVMDQLPEGAEIYDQDGESGRTWGDTVYKVGHRVVQFMNKGFQLFKHKMSSNCFQIHHEESACLITMDPIFQIALHPVCVNAVGNISLCTVMHLQRQPHQLRQPRPWEPVLSLKRRTVFP